MGKGLEGLAVIEIGGGFAASSTGKALADLGAEVVKVEPPEGDPVRGRGVVPGCGAPAGGPFLHLNANKRSVVLDRRGPPTGRPSKTSSRGRTSRSARGHAPDLEDAERWREGHPRLVVVSITPFGLTGPRRGWRGDELTLMHAGGWGYIVPGRGAPREWPPIRPFGHHALIQAGLHAAVAALAACRAARAIGLGDHLDVSVQETVAFLLGRHFTSFEYAGRIDHRSDRSIYEPMGFYPCRDGEAFIICPEQAQWERMAELIGEAEWASSELFGSRDDRGAHAPEIRERVSAWTRRRSAEEVFHALQEVRVGAAPVFDYPRLGAQEHLRARDFFVPVDHPGAGPIELPGPPYRLRRGWWRIARPAPALGEAQGVVDRLLSRPGPEARRTSDVSPAGEPDAGPLAGVRVLDLSWVWAGPHCTTILGALGAEVLKVESSKRLDLTRRASVHARELPPGPNRNGYFNHLGQHKKSVGIDLSKPEGRALVRRLATRCDVFVANFGTGVLERMGLGPAELLALNPKITVALISAFGQDGPLRLYTGYGPLISPLSGLSAQTGYAEDGRPRDVNMAYGDPNGGVHAAVAVTASLLARDLHRDDGGEDGGEGGQVIDVSMWEAMICTAFEGWMNHALGRRAVPAGGKPRSGSGSLQRLPLPRGGRMDRGLGRRAGRMGVPLRGDRPAGACHRSPVLERGRAQGARGRPRPHRRGVVPGPGSLGRRRGAAGGRGARVSKRFERGPESRPALGGARGVPRIRASGGGGESSFPGPLAVVPEAERHRPPRPLPRRAHRRGAAERAWPRRGRNRGSARPRGGRIDGIGGASGLKYRPGSIHREVRMDSRMRVVHSLPRKWRQPIQVPSSSFPSAGSKTTKNCQAR